MKKDTTNNWLFIKKTAPTVIAGTMIFGFSQAMAEFEEIYYDDSPNYNNAESDSNNIPPFTAIVHDEIENGKNYTLCNIKKIISKGNSNALILLEKDEKCYDEMYSPGEIIDGDGNLIKDDSLTFYIPTQTPNEYKAVASCTFNNMTLNQNGDLMIGAKGSCLSSKVDYTCFVENEHAFVLNVDFNQPSVCDDSPKDARAKSITAGNVTVEAGDKAGVEFKTRKNGTIRLLPPFTVAKNHVFRANTNPTS